MNDGERLLRDLPDIPRFVETRGAILSGRGRILSFEPGAHAVVVRPDGDLAMVVGHPTAEVVKEAASLASEVLVFPENHGTIHGILADRRSVLATLHALDAPVPDRTESTRLLSQSELGAADVPSELREELEGELLHSTPIMARWVNDRPVSFCYPCAITESLWDVSVDTLDTHRRRGYAAECFQAMAAMLAERGLAPVWGSAEDNAASMGLARELGFTPVDELFVLVR